MTNLPHNISVLAKKIFLVTIAILALDFSAQQIVTNSSWMVFLDNLHWTVSSTTAAMLAWLGYYGSSGIERLARRWFFIGITTYTFGQLLWDIQVFAGWNPFPAPSDLFYLTLGPACLIGLWVGMRNILPNHNHYVTILDFAMLGISVVALTLTIYLPRSANVDLLQLIVMTAYPLFLLGAACFGFLMMLHVRPRAHWSWILFQFGLVLEGLVWMWWNYHFLTGTLKDGALLNEMISVASVIMGIAAMNWRMVPSSSRRYEKISEIILQMLPIPTVIMAATASVLVLTFVKFPAPREVVLIAALTVILLAVVRQSLILNERQNLLEKMRTSEKEIYKLAFYDSLTRLPNRQLLLDRMEHALASSARSGIRGALLFIDLDNFKSVNDTLGHAIGDMLLQQVAQRLAVCVRGGDTVARLGGDEFVVMLEDLSTQTIDVAEQTELVGEKLLVALSQPLQLDIHQLHLSASIGASVFSGDEQNSEELLKQADIAMYQAKQSGRNTLRFFDPHMQEVINARVFLEGELRKALDNRQFELYYQIQMDSENRPLGAEALIRWIHPERGLVTPNQFITIAEETGLIVPIGLWVLETACAQLKQWEQDDHTRDFVLGVNVSARQFRQDDFVSQVQAVVKRHGIRPAHLKLELTESMLVNDIGAVIDTMNTLKASGIRFSMDDFGVGYSSLQYLQRLPLDQLKIDISFVRNLGIVEGANSIVQTIIAMAHSLKLDVIAEGVETQEQRDILSFYGCNRFQGYLFSKPVAIEQFEELIRGD
jgi:diguanylate cyclase (GGDEF)-like protein